MKHFILLLITMSAFTAAYSQNWTGAVNSDWNNPANWSQTPSNGDDIEIDPANYTGSMSQPVISVNSTFTPAEMLVQGGAHLTISANLSASDRVEILGDGTLVTITAGTFAVNGPGNNARLIFAEDAALLMTGGNLTAGQRLLFELGGNGTINGGTVTVGQTLALVDGSIAGGSFLILNNGTVTANGEFGFENEAGNFFPYFEQNGGTLNVNGDMLWLGADTGSGTGYFRILNGLTKVTGTITNDPASTMSLHIEISGAGALLQNSGTNVSTLAGDSIIVRNSGSWRDMNSVTWQNNGVFHSDSNGAFVSGNSTLIGSGSYQFCNIQVPVSKLMNHVLPSFISVSGNMVFDGTFNHNTNKIILNGDTEQSAVAAGLGFNFYSLEINNSLSNDYGVVFSSNVSVAHEAVFTSGLVDIGLSHSMIVAANALISGGSEISFVNGYMQKTGNQPVLFPLGTAPDRYRPLSLSAITNMSTVIRAAYKNTQFMQLTPVEAPLMSVSSIEYWDLSRTGSSDLFQVTAGWNNAGQSGLVNCDDISAAVWSGSQWEFIPSSTTGLCNGDNEGSLSTSVSVPVVGPFTIGFTENVLQQQITLCPGGSVTVGINTYTENGVYSDVLEDINGEDSTVITILTVLEPLEFTMTNNVISITANVPGAVAFQWIDCTNGNQAISGATANEFTPLVNGSYAVIAYQSDCTEGDTSECINITQLSVAEDNFSNVKIYPNPVMRGESFTVTSSGPIEELNILTVNGAVVKEKHDNSAEKVMISTNDLPSGIYFLELKNQQGISVTRFVVN